MGASRKRNSVKLSEAGKQRFIKAKAAKRDYEGNLWTDLDIAGEAGVSEKTVERFFSGKPVDEKTAIAIANALHVNDLENWLEPKESNSSDQTPETLIDWHHVCHKMLKIQQEKQKFRQQITGRGLGHEVKVYVPLGLVKPKEQPRRGEDFQPSADQGMLQYRLTEKEIEQEYKHDEFLEQVIEGKEKNLAIVGEPGAGKSTWLEEIACYVDNPEKGFPICIPLASLGGKTLEDYLLENWLEDALPFISRDAVEVTPVLQKKLKELFHSGKVWLLLDGVDEMRVQVYESPLQTIANQLRGWVDQARVVLTCRLNVWEANPNALPNFETYRTLHFDDEQVGDFIQQWFTREGKPKLGEQLEDKLRESGRKRIRDLIKNPLRLAMLCGIWYFNQGDLPKTKAALYQRFRDDFYQWKPHPLLTDDLDKQEELHTALSNLALEAIEKKLPLRKKFAHKVMAKSLFQLAREVGWLNWVHKDAETGEDVYAFFHLTFQEYFAACAIDDWHFFLNHDNENPNPLFAPNPALKYEDGKPAYRIFESQWKDVFLLWLGRSNTEVPNKQKEEFIQALVEFKDGCGGFYWYQTCFLAAAGLAEFFDCSRADEIVAQLVKWSLGYFNTRKDTWITFIEPITEGAIAALQQTERGRVHKTLISLFHNDYIPTEAKCKAADILAQTRCCSQEAIEFLTNLLDSELDSWSRCVVAKSLAQIESDNAKSIKALINLILEDPEPPINNFAAKCLEEINTDNLEIIHCLSEMLDLEYYKKHLSMQPSDIEAQRFWAAENLLTIAPDNQEAIKVVIELLRKEHLEHEWIRIAAIGMLPSIKTNNQIIINVCNELLDSELDEINRCYIAWALGMVEPGNQEAIQILIESVQNEKLYVCSHAVSCLEDIGARNEEVINALTELLDWVDSNIIPNGLIEWLRWRTAKSLSQIDLGNSKAITILTEILKSSKEYSKQAAKNLNTSLRSDQMFGIVSQLRDTLELLSKYGYENEAREEIREFFLESYCYKYEVLWHCAHNMTYPVFYQALHSKAIRSTLEISLFILEMPSINDLLILTELSGKKINDDRDIVDITPSDSTALTQSLNSAELPLLLRAAINNGSELSHEVQLICIDGSKFIDRDNPATKIYNEMRRQGCPKSEDSKPKTMAQLQDYWDELRIECDKCLVLVFYENPTGAKAQGFSNMFLDALSRFDGAICVVCDRLDILLQSFSPNQLNLIANIVGWIRQNIMEV